MCMYVWCRWKNNCVMGGTGGQKPIYIYISCRHDVIKDVSAGAKERLNKFQMRVKSARLN